LIVRTVFLLLLTMSWAAPALAAALVLDRAAQQGGLVLGRAAPGATVTLDGKTVAVGADGSFALGFSRDAGPSAALSVRWADGRAETRTLAVAKRKWRIQRIDGLPPGKVTPSARALKRIHADSAAIKAVRDRPTPEPWFRGGFAWPTKGRISGVYGSQRVLNGKPRRPHLGLDIAAPTGAPVTAAADGVVALVHLDMFYTGKTVLIDHGLGVGTSYSHMSAIFVKPGQRVAKGQRIGSVGQTGRSTGPHLHWGLTWYRLRLDPGLVVGPMPKVRGRKKH